jgi:hypothetical protein
MALALRRGVAAARALQRNFAAGPVGAVSGVPDAIFDRKARRHAPRPAQATPAQPLRASARHERPRRVAGRPFSEQVSGAFR